MEPLPTDAGPSRATSRRMGMQPDASPSDTEGRSEMWRLRSICEFINSFSRRDLMSFSRRDGMSFGRRDLIRGAVLFQFLESHLGMTTMSTAPSLSFETLKRFLKTLVMECINDVSDALMTSCSRCANQIDVHPFMECSGTCFPPRKVHNRCMSGRERSTADAGSFTCDYCRLSVPGGRTEIERFAFQTAKRRDE